MPIKNEAAKVHLVACLADALQNAITEKRGRQWSCVASTTTKEPASARDAIELLAMQIHLRGTIHGALRIEIAEKDAKILALDDSIPLSEAWQEVMESLVHRLPKRAADAGMFAFSVESCSLTASSPGYTQIGQMELCETGGATGILRVLANDELIESFQVAEWSASRTAAKADTQEIMTPELGRVIDVPLTVTLRFGQRSMRLREVLELNTGALVELDRQVEDPVDLILDERVIARGEVVIIDGNYGLRVTEVVERPRAGVS